MKPYFISKTSNTKSHINGDKRRKDNYNSKSATNKNKVSFITLITKECLDKYIETENGALAYSTLGNKLVDFNSAASSFRSAFLNKDTRSKEQIWLKFKTALNEDPINSIKYLLYLRDITNGLGERDVFRYLTLKAILNTGMVELLNIDIEEYGRWDDYVDLYFNASSSLKSYYDKRKPRAKDRYFHILNRVRETILKKIRYRLKSDKEAVIALSKDKYTDASVSLLAKWLPSVKTSSKETMNRARKLCKALKISEKEYRQTLSLIRKYLDVVEVKMSSNKWDNISYERVPSKANLLYSSAFLRHDRERREDFLDRVKKGITHINTKTLYPYEIVNRYSGNAEFNEDVELSWNSMVKSANFDLDNTLVIRDGSGSMTINILGRVTKLDVADSITLLAAQKCTGPFQNRFITFSSEPQIVDLSDQVSLLDKISYLNKFEDYTNTDIVKTFDLILQTAVNNKLKQKDLPKRVLVVSDMEFDGSSLINMTPFDEIIDKFKSYGYKLPKLVFWNISTCANAKFPVKKNKKGLLFVSGFSKSVFKMVTSDELDPVKALYSILSSDRYSVVDTIFKYCKDNYGKFQTIRAKSNNKRSNTNSKKEKSSLKQNKKVKH